MKKLWLALFALLFAATVMACSPSTNRTQTDVYITPKPTSDIPVLAPATAAATQTPVPLKTAEPDPTYSVDAQKPMLSLTFDDGPNTKTTTRILDVLEQNDARATFFVVGNRVDKHHECVERAYALGCEIGNHTFDHKKRLTELDADGLFDELNPTDELLLDYTGEIAPFIRPPWGNYNESVLAMVDRPLIRWNIDTLDWKTKDKEAIISEVIGKVKDGDIILMHDIYDSTADAVEYIVPKLIEAGYQLVTVTEMFEAKGFTMQAGYAYFYAGEKGIRSN